MKRKGVPVNDVLHAVAAGATNKEIANEFEVTLSKVARLRKEHAPKISQIQEKYSTPEQREIFEAGYAAAERRAGASDPVVSGMKPEEYLLSGSEEKSRAPEGWEERTTWTWVDGSVQLTGTQVFEAASADMHWRGHWSAIVETADRTQLRVAAFDGKAIETILKAEPQRGDILHIRCAHMDRDWIWIVYIGSETRVKNIGRKGTMTKPRVSGHTKLIPDLGTFKKMCSEITAVQRKLFDMHVTD